MSILVSCLYHFFKFNLAINNFLNQNLWFRWKQLNEKIYSNRIIKVVNYNLNLVERELAYRSFFPLDLFNYIFYKKTAGLKNYDFDKEKIYELSYSDNTSIFCRGGDIKTHISENTHRHFSNNTFIHVGLNIGFHKKDITTFVNKRLKLLSNIRAIDIVKILRISNIISEYDYNCILESQNEPCITCITCDQDLILTSFNKDSYMI